MRLRFVLVAQLVLVYFDIVAQRPAPTASFSELLRERAEQSFCREIPAHPVDLETHHLLDGEMLEQRHDVGEPFMKSENIEVGGFLIAPV